MRLFCSLLLTLTLAGALPAADPFCDPKLPLEARVNNLVSLMTLDEKIAFLGRRPAIDRLGIKSFTNFTEGLHGLGWASGGSITSTQFPQDRWLQPGIPTCSGKWAQR